MSLISLTANEILCDQVWSKEPNLAAVVFSDFYPSEFPDLSIGLDRTHFIDNLALWAKAGNDRRRSYR